MSEWWWIASALLVFVGLLGTFLPFLPGVPLVFLGLLLGAWIDGFQKVGEFTMLVLFLLTLLAAAVEWLAGYLGAKKVGASKAALVGAALGALFGFVLGPIVGAIIGEVFVNPDWRNVTKVGIGTWLGVLLGGIAKLLIAFAMIGLFVGAYWY
jgi:hypothetical protein